MERVLVSDRYHVSRRELEEYWTVLDVLTAHQVLDALEDAQDRARAQADPQHPGPRHRPR